VPQDFRIEAAIERLGRRNEARRVMTAVVDPERAVLLGGDEQLLDRHAFDAPSVRLDHEVRAPARHAQDLERQGRQHRATDVRDHRDPAHYAVLDVGAQDGMAGGGVLELGEIGQRGVEAAHAAARVVADHPHRGRPRRAARSTVDAGHPQHGLALSQRRREQGVVARQRTHLPQQGWIDGRDVLRDLAGRSPVDFRHQDVQRHCSRFGAPDPVEHPGGQVARPRPLAELLEARLVDVDDHHRGRHPLARHHRLI